MTTKNFLLTLTISLLAGCGGEGDAVVAVSTPNSTVVFYSGEGGSGTVAVVGAHTQETASGCAVIGNLRNQGNIECDAALRFLARGSKGETLGEGEAQVRGMAPGAEASYLAPLLRSYGDTALPCREIADVTVQNGSECGQ